MKNRCSRKPAIVLHKVSLIAVSSFATGRAPMKRHSLDPKMPFGARQAIERVEQYQSRALPGFGRQFVIKLDRKAKGVDCDARFVGQFIGQTRRRGPRFGNQNMPNAHALSYDEFPTLSKKRASASGSADRARLTAPQTRAQFPCAQRRTLGTLVAAALNKRPLELNWNAPGCDRAPCFACLALRFDPLYAKHLDHEALLKTHSADGSWPVIPRRYRIFLDDCPRGERSRFLRKGSRSPLKSD